MEAYNEPMGGGDGAETEVPEPPDASETAGKSALLPKSMFPGEVSPGSTITLKVSAVYGDEVAVEMVSEPSPSTEPPMSADEEIDMMAGGTE
jgi:hypothetical protein